MFGMSGWKEKAVLAVIVVGLVILGAAIQARKPFVQTIPVIGKALAGA